MLCYNFEADFFKFPCFDILWFTPISTYYHRDAQKYQKQKAQQVSPNVNGCIIETFHHFKRKAFQLVVTGIVFEHALLSLPRWVRFPIGLC